MSIATFIPQVWEAALMKNFYEHSIVNTITTKPTKIEGNKIIFNRISKVAINDYTGNVTYPDLETTKVELPMDIKKLYSFSVDDVDAVQAAGDIMGPAMQDSASGIQQEIDRLVLAEALSNKSNAITKAAGENIYDVIVNLNMALNKKRVPKTGRYIVINAEALADLEKDARFTHEYTLLENGLMEGARVKGIQLIFSEELNYDEKIKDSKEAVLLLHTSAIGYGSQLQTTEAMRLENKFADGVRSLQVCGCKTLRPEAIAFYAKAASTDTTGK